MESKYRVRPGVTFVMPDGSRVEAGDIIELAADLALMHMERLEVVQKQADVFPDPLDE